jgi:predicted Fe-S protein YdhL (DUF1289 family)
MMVKRMMVERTSLMLPARHARGEAVPSPCSSVCRIDPATRWCEGCLRTLDEIADWSVLGGDEKRAIWFELAARFDVLHAKGAP